MRAKLFFYLPSKESSRDGGGRGRDSSNEPYQPIQSVNYIDAINGKFSSNECRLASLGKNVTRFAIGVTETLLRRFRERITSVLLSRRKILCSIRILTSVSESTQIAPPHESARTNDIVPPRAARIEITRH